MFGTSRELNVGPVAIVSLMTFETLNGLGILPCDVSLCMKSPPLDDAMCVACVARQATYSEAAVTLAFLSGLMQIVLGLLHLGVLASFLAQPVVTGFNFASGILVSIVFSRFSRRVKILIVFSPRLR